MSRQERTSSPHFTKLQQVVTEHLQPPEPGVALPLFPDRSDRLLGIFDLLGAWVCEADQGGRITYTSPLVESLLGFSVDEVLESDCLEFHPDDITSVIEVGRKVRESGVPAGNQARVRHKAGHWVWFEAYLVGWYEESGGDYHTITFSRDITELKLAEAAHQEAEERYRVVSQMSCDLIAEVDAKGRPTYVSPSCEKILGIAPETLLATKSWSRMHPEDSNRVAAQLKRQLREARELGATTDGITRPPELMEFRVRHRDGQWIWFESLGQVYERADGAIRFLAVGRDVSERKRAEEAKRQLELSMQRAQKLESLGVLAGGIAHDFNNLLTPILGAAALGQEELPDDSPVRVRFEKIANAARRASALTSQMLAYAGQQPLRLEHLDLSKLVHDMRDLVSSSISGRTLVDLDLSFDLPAIEVEPAQISQVVMNLISNASESLAEGKGRVIARTGVVEIDAPPAGALFAETMTPGKHVYFEVIDNGCGMNAATLDKIFDPFYSTKFAGRGLGLAAVAGIVRGHHGAIEVESEPDSGSRFRVLIPVSRETTQIAERELVDIACWRTSGTALVVDDDEGVRELAQEILERAGLQVLTARDGHEGAESFAKHADKIRVVLLDRTMPSLSGAQTAASILAERPDARIVIVSGYSEERIAAELAGQGIAGFLQKPFSPEALLTRVRDALEAPGQVENA